MQFRILALRLMLRHKLHVSSPKCEHDENKNMRIGPLIKLYQYST